MSRIVFYIIFIIALRCSVLNWAKICIIRHSCRKRHQIEVVSFETCYHHHHLMLRYNLIWTACVVRSRWWWRRSHMLIYCEWCDPPPQAFRLRQECSHAVRWIWVDPPVLMHLTSISLINFIQQTEYHQHLDSNAMCPKIIFWCRDFVIVIRTVCVCPLDDAFACPCVWTRSPSPSM